MPGVFQFGAFTQADRLVKAGTAYTAVGVGTVVAAPGAVVAVPSAIEAVGGLDGLLNLGRSIALNPEYALNAMDFIQAFVPDGGSPAMTWGGISGFWISAAKDILEAGIP
jgi:hypothetical protein